MRIDKRLQELGYFTSRNKASEAIDRGDVFVDGRVVDKPSLIIYDGATIEIVGQNYVSRSAYKLREFLEEVDITISGVDGVDIGASSGGFTQVLLEKGARSVTCIDVGRDQLSMILKNDSRVHNYEECDIREFQSEKRYQLSVCDLSFISTKVVLEHIDRISLRDIVILFKPQFEVGKDAKRDRKGVLKEPHLIEKAKDEFIELTTSMGWHLNYSSLSKLKGKEGNEERFFYFSK